MNRRFNSMVVAATVFVAWLSLGLPVRAQIASTVSESGKLVFTNAEPPKPPVKRLVIPRGFHRKNMIDVESPAEAEMMPSVVPPDRLERIVKEAANRHSLDPALVKAVIGVESGWNPGAVSHKGALGLMQLVPSTAEQLGVGNAFDPVQNVEGGARYLRSLLDRFHGDLEKSLAAYNAGPGIVERFGGIPNFRETRSYVQRVTNSYFRPGSGRNPALWNAPRAPVRREVDERGRVVFTNE